MVASFEKASILIERRFFQNLRSREVRAEYLGEKKPEYAGRLLSHDLHLADLEIRGIHLGGKNVDGTKFGKEIWHSYRFYLAWEEKD